MNDNTILRIKVPAHLYESVKEQLTLKESKNRLSEAISGTDEELMAFYEKVKQMEAEGTDLESAISYAKFDIENPDAAKELSSMNEAKKGAHNLGAGMELVKEKKMKVPKDGMKKVEETIEETNENMEKKMRTLDELKSAKSKLEKKIEEMENGDHKIDEIDPKFQGAMDVLGSIPGIDKIAQIDPFTAGVALVGMVVGGLVAAPKIEKGIKALMAKIKDPKKKAQLAAAAEKGGVSVGGEVM